MVQSPSGSLTVPQPAMTAPSLRRVSGAIFFGGGFAGGSILGSDFGASGLGSGPDRASSRAPGQPGIIDVPHQAGEEANGPGDVEGPGLDLLPAVLAAKLHPRRGVRDLRVHIQGIETVEERDRFDEIVHDADIAVAQLFARHL